ncbi:dienelactone hydrolase family protein [Streptosporangium lutulentum]
MGSTVAITGGGEAELEAYLARPLGDSPRGGVVVIHHLPGYDESTKEIVRTFAAHGYAAICPNLYSREGAASAPTTRPPPHGPRAVSLTSSSSATSRGPRPTSTPSTTPTARSA